MKNVLQKIQYYCAYQDRCEMEVRTKLLSLKVQNDEIEDYINVLKNDDFIDDARYVRSFVRSKLNGKMWGKIKIKKALLEKNIDNNLINNEIDGISTARYSEIIDSVIEKWIRSNEALTYDNYPKLYRFLLSKGFDNESINQTIKKYIK